MIRRPHVKVLSVDLSRASLDSPDEVFSGCELQVGARHVRLVPVDFGDGAARVVRSDRRVVRARMQVEDLQEVALSRLVTLIAELDQLLLCRESSLLSHACFAASSGSDSSSGGQ